MMTDKSLKQRLEETGKCTKPDRHNPDMYCGWPEPCPWHSEFGKHPWDNYIGEKLGGQMLRVPPLPHRRKKKKHEDKRIH